jgi:Tol biopolymer transport system component
MWTEPGKIFFLHYDALYSVDPDGSGLARLKRPKDASDFAFSADGKMLAYRSDERIAALPLDSAGRQVTLLEPVSDYILHDTSAALGWTWDGRAIVVAGGSGDTIHGSRLYVVDADGSGLSAVPGIETALDPDWRPE